MKVYEAGEKIQALCHNDGDVTVTFDYRDVPFRDKRGVAENILVGVCDTCKSVIFIPAQSTPAIAAARKRAERALEVSLPSPFVEVLDAAAMRVNSHATTEFRKHLIVYYVNRYACGAEKSSELVDLANKATEIVSKSVGSPNKRLSMKLADFASVRVDQVLNESRLSKTELIKSLVVKINEDIVQPKHPKHLAELSSMADVLFA